jgi:hypothetical protein
MQQLDVTVTNFHTDTRLYTLMLVDPGNKYIDDIETEWMAD